MNLWRSHGSRRKNGGAFPRRRVRFVSLFDWPPSDHKVSAPITCFGPASHDFTVCGGCVNHLAAADIDANVADSAAVVRFEEQQVSALDIIKTRYLRPAMVLLKPAALRRRV